MEQIIKTLLEKIEKFEKDPATVQKLPDNNYYLDNDYILCGQRQYGVSRYPYESDGLVLWASDNGHITANESELTVFRPSYTDEVPCMGFFLGIKQPDGTYLPISATEANGQVSEPAGLKRYTVFAPAAAYYITITDDFYFCVRVFLDDSKESHFTMYAYNRGKENAAVYLASYFEALLRYEESEGYWVRKARSAVKLDNGNIVMKTNHFLTNCLSINYDIDRAAAKEIYTTVSSIDFTGRRGRSFANGLALKTGCFAGQGKVDWKNEYASLPIAGNITHFDLVSGECCQLDVSFLQSYDFAEAKETAAKVCTYPELSCMVEEKEKRLTAALQPLSMRFGDWTAGALDPEVLNRFLKTVQRQVEICSFGKSYAGPRLGVRDVFQQLEAALLWAPNAVRQRILLMFAYLDPSGRAPRQITITPNEKLMPNLDIRPFIDQGFWMIDTVYSYLCHTGDYSILEEECGYCNLPDKPKAHLCRVEEPCSERNSLLEHMLRIVCYLESNLDRKYQTNCLRVLFGDWNDALDGMGASLDPDELYGSGVTVMGTLQFYRNLERMSDILEHIGGYEETIKHYAKLRDEIQEGFFKYAVQTNEAGEKRIVHGWGDRLSYFVGSFCDTDGKDRVSFASNAFYALSGMMASDDSLKSTAVATLKSLDSQYGLLTLKPAFSPETKGVGRIAVTPPGTAENCCAYVHASLFSICSLFMMGESEFAWKQLHKSMVITHEKPSLTAFAMPNSYLHNEDRGLDGESAGDWFTGSGTVLVKGLVKYGFGIMPDLDGLVVAMPANMPCKECDITITIKGCPVTLKYRNEDNGCRSYSINGKVCELQWNTLSNTHYIRIENDALYDKLLIEVTD